MTIDINNPIDVVSVLYTLIDELKKEGNSKCHKKERQILADTAAAIQEHYNTCKKV